MPFSGGSLVSFLIALSFASGLNLYATVATLGIMGRIGWLDLPTGLSLLSSGWILYPSLVLFLIEVFADHIPFVRLAWNVGHLFVRAPIAALMAYHAATPLSPEMQLAVAVGSGIIATLAHSSKTATRVIAAEGGVFVPSVVLNGSGDVVAVALMWLASRHPVVSALTVVAMLALTFYFVRRAYHAIGHEITSLQMRTSAWWATHHAHRTTEARSRSLKYGPGTNLPLPPAPVGHAANALYGNHRCESRR